MNYLAHLYLSQTDNDLALGNFIADYVKGNHYQKFNQQVVRGIFMHRSIDSTTDSHPSYLETKMLFRESHGRYSGIVTDIVFDYILAKNWEALNEVPLDDFQKRINKILIYNFPILPIKAKLTVPFFIRNRWLLLYCKTETLTRVLRGMNKFRGIEGNVDQAITILIENESTITGSFFNTVNSLVVLLAGQYPEILFTENKLKQY